MSSVALTAARAACSSVLARRWLRNRVEERMKHNPIICAVDTTDVEKAKTLSRQLQGSVGAVKLGLEFFTANGRSGVAQIASQQFPVFLDLKFHDIPNTVAGAVRAT